MYRCENWTIKEAWALKNWCFQTVVLEKTLESPMDGKEIKLVNPKGNQPWIFIGRTDAEAEAPVLWPPDAKNWLIGKDADAGKDWRQKEKRTTEDEMVRWHHQLNGHECERTLGDKGTWRAAVNEVAKSRTQQSNWTATTNCKQALFITQFLINIMLSIEVNSGNFSQHSQPSHTQARSHVLL